MIEAYFDEIEAVIAAFPNIRTYTLKKKIYNTNQGYIGGAIIFTGGNQLDFIEVKRADVSGKIKYRYQFMREDRTLIFRYDNAPHHQEVDTFPHHKHMEDGVIAAPEPTLRGILLEIALRSRQ